jgi:Holliday junction resolvase
LGTNYQRGRTREYKVLHMLRSDGWVCSRSAICLGPVDIFAARRGKVLLIQVKIGSGRMGKQELTDFRAWADDFNANAEIWYFKKKGKLQSKAIRINRVKQVVHKKARVAWKITEDHLSRGKPSRAALVVTPVAASHATAAATSSAPLGP